jgi:fructokinase
LAVDPIGDALLSLARREAGSRVVSVDPNLRPAMVGALDGWRARIDDFARCAAIMKLSEEDLVTGWDARESADCLAAAWLSNGVNLVVMTEGARGATAWWAGGKASVTGRTVAMVDTVGAGDSFHAALLGRLWQRGLLRREALAKLDQPAVEDALGYAIAAASITCGRRGADVPRRVEVEAMMGAA